MENKNVFPVLTEYGVVKLRKESKTGNIFLHYYYTNIDGVKKRKKQSMGISYNKKNLEATKNWLLNREMDATGIFISKKDPINKSFTVKEFLTEVEKSIQNDSNRGRTKDNYISMLNNNLIPFFGDYYLDEVTIHDLEEMFKSLKNIGKDVKTLKNIKTPINKFFDIAFKKDIIKSNPVKDIDKKIFEDKKQLLLKGKGYDLKTKKELIELQDNDVDPFTEEEVIKIFNKTPEGQFKNFIGILFFTGMRPSEAICLKWENIDLDQKYLIIEEARTGYETKKEVEEGHNKTYSSKRIVDLSEHAIKYIKEQKKYSNNK